MAVALFRHGLTAENERRAYIGWSNSSLSDFGIDRLLAKGTPEKRYEKIYASDLVRATQTATYYFPKQVIEKDDRFRELNFGHWEGKTYQELKNIPAYCQWLDSPLEIAPLNGEFFSHFTNRVDEGWDKLVRNNEGRNRLALVTHGGVISYLLSKYSFEEKGFFDYSIEPGSGLEMIWSTKEAFRRKERCTLLQEVAFTEKNSGR